MRGRPSRAAIAFLVAALLLSGCVSSGARNAPKAGGLGDDLARAWDDFARWVDDSRGLRPPRPDDNSWKEMEWVAQHGKDAIACRKHLEDERVLRELGLEPTHLALVACGIEVAMSTAEGAAS